VVCVFARQTSEPLASLVKQIDQQIGEHPNLKSFVVIMSRDGAKTSEALRKLAAEAGVKHVPLTMTGEINGPPDYDIAKGADITVLMWSKHSVTANHGFKGELTDKDVATVMSDIPRLLGK
jgi:hypothetical protein